MTPIFLWSTVVIQLQNPLVAVGRRKMVDREAVVVT